jgi:hypothetical protein
MPQGNDDTDSDEESELSTLTAYSDHESDSDEDDDSDDDDEHDGAAGGTNTAPATTQGNIGQAAAQQETKPQQPPNKGPTGEQKHTKANQQNSSHHKCDLPTTEQIKSVDIILEETLRNREPPRTPIARMVMTCNMQLLNNSTGQTILCNSR